MRRIRVFDTVLKRWFWSDAPSEGGSSPLSVLGPFTVSFDDPGITSDGVVLCDVPMGSIVLDARAFFVTSFTGPESSPNDAYLYLALGPESNPSGWHTIYKSREAQIAGDSGGYQSEGITQAFDYQNSGADLGTRWVIASVPGVLVAYLEPDGELDQGEALVYATVYTP